jgi:hypothetical protein
MMEVTQTALTSLSYQQKNQKLQKDGLSVEDMLVFVEALHEVL